MPLLPDRKNFHLINAAFLDPLVLEAVDLDDLESIEGILSWRDVKAKEIGLNDVDKKLLMMQKKAQAGKHLHFSYLLSFIFRYSTIVDHHNEGQASKSKPCQQIQMLCKSCG